jgi:hypothetical protein
MLSYPLSFEDKYSMEMRSSGCTHRRQVDPAHGSQKIQETGRVRVRSDFSLSKEHIISAASFQRVRQSDARQTTACYYDFEVYLFWDISICMSYDVCD